MAQFVYVDERKPLFDTLRVFGAALDDYANWRRQRELDAINKQLQQQDLKEREQQFAQREQLFPAQKQALEAYAARTQAEIEELQRKRLLDNLMGQAWMSILSGRAAPAPPSGPSVGAAASSNTQSVQVPGGSAPSIASTPPTPTQRPVPSAEGPTVPAMGDVARQLQQFVQTLPPDTRNQIGGAVAADMLTRFPAWVEMYQRQRLQDFVDKQFATALNEARSLGVTLVPTGANMATGSIQFEVRANKTDPLKMTEQVQSLARAFEKENIPAVIAAQVGPDGQPMFNVTVNSAQAMANAKNMMEALSQNQAEQSSYESRFRLLHNQVRELLPVIDRYVGPGYGPLKKIWSTAGSMAHRYVGGFDKAPEEARIYNLLREYINTAALSLSTQMKGPITEREWPIIFSALPDINSTPERWRQYIASLDEWFRKQDEARRLYWEAAQTGQVRPGRRYVYENGRLREATPEDILQLRTQAYESLLQRFEQDPSSKALFQIPPEMDNRTAASMAVEQIAPKTPTIEGDQQAERAAVAPTVQPSVVTAPAFSAPQPATKSTNFAAGTELKNKWKYVVGADGLIRRVPAQ